MSQIPKHVMDSFFGPLIAVLGEPNTPDPERFLSEYGRMLRGYGAQELAEAADHVLATYKGPARWPRIPDCIEAAEHARERLQFKRGQKQSVEADYFARANAAERAMMDSQIGHAAAREGWANGLRDFIMEKRRLPHDHEIHRLKENAEFIDRCAAGTINMGIIHDQLQKLAQKMVDRRHAIADRVLSGIVRERP